MSQTEYKQNQINRENIYTFSLLNKRLESTRLQSLLRECNPVVVLDRYYLQELSSLFLCYKPTWQRLVEVLT